MIVEQLPHQDWLTLVNRSTTEPVTPFQHPAWVEYQTRSISGASDCSLAFRFADGTVAAVPLVRIRNRFGYRSYWGVGHDEYGGILSEQTLAHDSVQTIYSYLAREYRPIRLTMPPSLSAAEPIPEPPAPWRHDDHSTHILVLPDSYDDWFSRRISKTCRTDIRRGEKSGLTISNDGSDRNIDAYFHLYQLSADRWQGSASARRKTREDFVRLLSCPLTRLRIVYKGDQPAAGMITIESNTYTLYYLGASDKTLADSRPTDFGVAEMVRTSIAEGKRVINLGASLGLDSLERFKEKFGAAKQPYRSYFLPTVVTSVTRSYRYYRSRLR